MDLLSIVILSIVEGLTEFLPISSTAHLILASRVLNIEGGDFLKSFQIIIQLGAIMAVVTLYSKKFLTSFEIYKKLLVAFMPTAIVGFTFYPLIKDTLLSGPLVSLYALFLGGIALITIEKFFKTREFAENKNIKYPTYRQALVIGCFQSLSVIPGVSRAAATIFGGLFTGLNRPSSTEFSFLLAVPTMLAASGLDVYKSRHLISQGGALSMFLGVVLSYIFAMMAIKFLINYIKNHDFTVFGVYRIILALLFWIFVM